MNILNGYETYENNCGCHFGVTVDVIQNKIIPYCFMCKYVYGDAEMHYLFIAKSNIPYKHRLQNNMEIVAFAFNWGRELKKLSFDI